MERFPIILMALRLLDYSARYDPRLRRLEIQTRPYATEWLNLLGDLLYGRRDEAPMILYSLAQKAAELAEQLREDYPEAAETLNNDIAQPNAVWRLAEALTTLQGRTNTQNNVISLLDSSLMIGRPNGLATRRSVTRQATPGGPSRRRDLRWLVFTNSVLDYLVHRHVLRPNNKSGYRALSFKSFVQVLYERYGFCIDREPPGMTISNELLQRNRLVLERRLRDLGLLIGVNDAESMKQLRPRFQRLEEQNDVD